MGFHKQVVDKLLTFDEETRNKAYIMYSQLFYIKSSRMQLKILTIGAIVMAEIIAYLFMVSYNERPDLSVMFGVGIVSFAIMRVVIKCSLERNLIFVIERIKFEISYNLEFLEIIQDISKFDKRLTTVILMI